MDLPNPVHGMSNVNLAVGTHAKSQGLTPRVINTVPSYAAKYFGFKFWSFVKILHTLFCYAFFLSASFFNINKVVYRPINGGSGQVYDLIYITICRIFLNKIYIHHHSFNYLNRRSRLFSILNKLAGKKAKHIVLGVKMRDKLVEHYGISKSNVYVLSNLAFFDLNENETPAARDVVKIGHLANLCGDKGIDVFINVCTELEKLNLPYEAKIAGPFADKSAEDLISTAIRENINIEYLGALYGNDKLDFYRNIDCFIFPSKYKNEAEPLVLYEAAAQANFLIGTQRGCMEDVISSLGGASFPENDELVNNIVNSVIELQQSNKFKYATKVARAERFKQEYVKAKKSLDQLLEEMK